ncbi:MAG: hypothetical protein J2P58_08225 [Acidimicrobiaceae bacterium]|nr:hypothetical protein [Acidimicrobiaceae bacterium]MBO0748782.1 hypothetical protein [Acidimicrobiaceae bacterium]
MTHGVAPAELQAGDVVVEDDSTRYEVHAVKQHQGQCQVSDTEGLTHTYAAEERVEVE